jgi:hypothetical protein
MWYVFGLPREGARERSLIAYGRTGPVVSHIQLDVCSTACG